jgi:hypothetical protein
MKRAPAALHHHRPRPRRPRMVLAAEREGFRRHQLLLPSSLPRVVRLIAVSKRRGFKACVEFHPLEGSIFTAVKCRFCPAYFSPWARGEQRRHARQHRTHC